MERINKKGEVSDMLMFVVTIFVLAVGLFVLMYIIPSITSGLNTAGLNNTAEGASAINSMDGTFTGMLNNGFMLLFVGLTISVMITSFLVRTHPIFLFLYIIFLIVTVILSFYLGNAYAQMSNNPIFAGMLSDATFFNLVMGHIAEITIAVGALSMIIVFSKFSTFGGSQQF
jgi:hypothetical protein